MNLKLLSFISISFHNFFFNQDKSIEKFWRDENNINFGYYDTIGNIYKIDNRTKSTKLLYKNINHLNNFKYIDDYHILNFDDIKNENSCIIKDNSIMSLKWNDSTLFESIYNKNYYRINYFGDIYIKNLVNKTSFNVKIAENMYYQDVTNYKEYLFTIDDRNVFHVYDFNHRFEEKLFYELKEASNVKKMIVRKLGSYFNILILYGNSKIDILTINFNENDNLFMFYNKNSINSKLKIIDCEFKSTFVIISSERKIIFYKFNPFAVSVQKLIDKNLSIPYYTSILWFDKFLLFNNYNFIPYILINFND